MTRSSANKSPIVAARPGGAGKTIVQRADGTVETLSGKRSTRNNNPANMEYGKFARSHGAIGTDGRFAVFPDMTTGFRANLALLSSSGYRNKTVREAIAQWAPAFENNVKAYERAVSGLSNIPMDAKISDLTPSQLNTVMAAMSVHEGLPSSVANGLLQSNLQSIASQTNNPSTLGGLSMSSGAALGRIGEARYSSMTDQYGSRITTPTASQREMYVATPTFREEAIPGGFNVAAYAQTPTYSPAAMAAESAVNGRTSTTQPGRMDAIDVNTPYDRSYGPNRPADPRQSVLDATRAAVGGYFGPGYSVTGISGTGNYGGSGHRPTGPEGKGRALDFDIIGPDGRKVTDKATIDGFLGHLAEKNPTASIGHDKYYMGPGRIHFALDDRSEYWGANNTKYGMNPKHPGVPNLDPTTRDAILAGRERARNKPAPVPTARPGTVSLAEDQRAAVASTFADTVSKISDLYGVSPAVAAEQLVPGISASVSPNASAQDYGNAFASISAGVAGARKSQDIASIGGSLISAKGKEYAQSAIIADKINTTAQELGVPYSVVAEQMVPGISASLQPNASLKDIASTVSGLAGQVASVSKTTPDEAASKITGGAYQSPFGAAGSAVASGNKMASASASANVPQAQAASLPSRGRVNEYAPNAGYRAPSASVGRVNSYAPMAGVAAVPTARPSYTPPELAYAAPETTSQYQPGPFSFTRQTTPQPTVPQENIGPYGVNPDLPRDIDGRMQSQSQYDARRTGLPTPTARPGDYNVASGVPVDAVTQSRPSVGRVNAYAPNAGYQEQAPASSFGRVNAYAPNAGRVESFTPSSDVASGSGGGGWGNERSAMRDWFGSFRDGMTNIAPPERQSMQSHGRVNDYAPSTPQQSAASYGRVNAYAPNAGRVDEFSPSSTAVAGSGGGGWGDDWRDTPSSGFGAAGYFDSFRDGFTNIATPESGSTASRGRVNAYAPNAGYREQSAGLYGTQAAREAQAAAVDYSPYSGVHSAFNSQTGLPMGATGTAVASRTNPSATGSIAYEQPSTQPATISEGIFGKPSQAASTAPNSGMSVADQYASYGIGHNSAYVAPIDRPGSAVPQVTEAPQAPTTTGSVPQVTAPTSVAPGAPQAQFEALPPGYEAGKSYDIPQVGHEYPSLPNWMPGTVVDMEGLPSGGYRVTSIGQPQYQASPFPSIFSPIGRLMTPFIGGFGQPGGMAGGLFGAVAGALSGLNANDIGGTGIPTFDKVMSYNKAQQFANANQTAMQIGKDSRGKLGWGNAGPLSAGAAGAGWMSNNPERSYGGYGSGYDPTPT